MKVLVTGATGVIGGPAVHELLAAGHDVAAVARSSTKARALEDEGATPVTVDLYDPTAVAAAVEGRDAVVNLATKIPSLSKAMRPSAWKENHRIRREVSRNLVDAALAADVDIYVQESLAFAYPDRGDAWVDEDTPLAPAPVARTILDAEAQAQRFTEAGRTGVVLRFSQFYGPTGTHTEEIVRMANRRLAPAMGPKAYRPLLHVDDGGAAVAAALRAPAGVYNVVDDEPLRGREYADTVADALGARRPLVAPGWVAALMGRNARMTARSIRATNRRFKAATDWAPRYPTARQGWAAVVQQRAAAEQKAPEEEGPDA